MLTEEKGVWDIWSMSWHVQGLGERKFQRNLTAKRSLSEGLSTCHLLHIHPTASSQVTLPFQSPVGSRLAGVGGK